MRLQRYIAQTGLTSRRKAEALIVEGKVRVNGKTVTKLGTTVDPKRDRIEISGESLSTPIHGLILFHKPRLVLSTLDDPRGRPTVKDYLSVKERGYFLAGRLDFDTSGLVVLTNDGDLAEKLTHPRYGIDRVYEAKLKGSLDDQMCRKIKKGIELDDGVARADVKIVERSKASTWCEVTVREGRNRLIRRLFDAVDFPVLKLRRTKFGPFELGQIPIGKKKRLSDREFQRSRSRIIE